MTLAYGSPLSGSRVDPTTLFIGKARIRPSDSLGREEGAKYFFHWVAAEDCREVREALKAHISHTEGYETYFEHY